jgi:predicted porin
MGDFAAMRSKSIVPGKLKNVVRKSFLSTVASVAFVVSANAADLNTIFTKAPPEMPALTWNGITLIGAIDVAGQYESHSTPYAGQINSTASMIFPSNQGPGYFLAPNQTIQSYIGVKVDEKLTNELSFVARLESGFNPTTGELVNGPKSLQLSNGIALANQNVSADASRAGQIFNGEAYGGLALKGWGELRVGRNTNVSTNMIAAYDPLFSLGFSLLGFQGAFVGQGSIGPVYLDQSIKYTNQIGMFRTSLIYGAPGTNVKQFYQVAIGIVRPEFSVDLLGGRSSDQVALSSLSGAANLGSQFLGARVFDSSMYGIFGKYVFDVGGKGYADANSAKFIVSGGWNHLDFSNPSDGGLLPGHTDIGGFQIGPALSMNGAPGAGIVNYAYTGGNRLLDALFIAGKYQYNEHWSVAAAYYTFLQNSFGFGVNKVPGVTSAIYSNTSCSSNAFFNCSGNEQVFSLRVDYDWNKNAKLYAGVTYSKVSGGLSFGYLNTDQITPTVGARYSF